MSMLTAQVDKLRETAANLREHSTFVGFGGVINRDPMLFDAAQQMEDAASAIEGLRDRLTGESENKDLRKQIGDADRINGRLVGENESLKAENEKLRQLVRDMWCDGMCDCDEQYTCAECEYGYHDRMRELGIEVERCQA